MCIDPRTKISEEVRSNGKVKKKEKERFRKIRKFRSNGKVRKKEKERFRKKYASSEETGKVGKMRKVRKTV